MSLETQPFSQPVKPILHWPSLLQLLFSLLAVVALIGGAAVVGISAAYRYFSGNASTDNLVQPAMVTASLTFAGILVLPSAWYAWRHIAHPERESAAYQERRGFGLILTIIVVVLVAGAILLGNWVAQHSQLTWLVLPPLNVIANGLPALWLVYIGTRRLIPSTPRRIWGVFASGLVLGPLIILVLELILLVVVGVLAVFWAMLNPALSSQLTGLVNRMQHIGPNLDGLIRLLVPFLLNPGIIFLIFAYIAVMVPLLEEALKPIGVWFLGGQKITSTQGFGFGVLSGAGFGLFENLGNTSGGTSEWALLATTRISTLMLHCFTAGLVGWALASAWSERRYWRLAITYAIAVIVHGSWNGMALLSAATSLQDYTNVTLPAYLKPLGALSSIGIIALGVLVLVLYLSSNVILRRRAIAETLPLPWEERGSLAQDSSLSTSEPAHPDQGFDSPPSTDPADEKQPTEPQLHPNADNPIESKGKNQ